MRRRSSLCTAATAGLLWAIGLQAVAQPTVPSAASVAPASTISAVGTTPAPATAGAYAAPAGSWRLLRQIKLPNPGAASLDRKGALFVADADNNLRQFGAEGMPLNHYAPPQPGHVGQVEAWNITNILLFYDDRQELVLLDRFLNPLAQLRLSEYLDGMVRAATLASDNHIWLLDESNLVLRELDPTTLRFTNSTPLDLLIGRTRPDFRFLRQYQNNTYLLDRTTGIYVFDNLGNYKKKLPFPGLSTIGFRGDELYYVSEGILHFFHLYNLTERVMPLPADIDIATVRQVLIGEGFAYVLTAQGVQVYQML